MLCEKIVGAAAALVERQSAKRAHEGDRFARVHRRVEAALLRQIANPGRGIERPFVAQHAARSARRIDDPEQDSQYGRLARSVGPEEAVNGAGGHREANAIDRTRGAEILDEIDRFDGQTAGHHIIIGLSKH